MSCPNVKECACPKKTCPNNGRCCACVIKHRETDSLPRMRKSSFIPLTDILSMRTRTLFVQAV